MSISYGNSNSGNNGINSGVSYGHGAQVNYGQNHHQQIQYHQDQYNQNHQGIYKGPLTIQAWMN